MKIRSYLYPDECKKFGMSYIDNTHHDQETESLDMGFQRVKLLKLPKNVEMSTLRILLIDHNNLEILPSPLLLPNLIELTCSFNKISEIPFYPKLKFLNIANNIVTKLTQYHNSTIEYLDVSRNPISLSITLPKCSKLYMSNCNLLEFDINLFPNTTILDISNNNIKTLFQHSLLEELDCQMNKLEELPLFPSLVRLFANNNMLKTIKIYPKLIQLEISNNRLSEIPLIPNLERVIANNNMINKFDYIGDKMIFLDLGNNQLKIFPKLNHKLEFVYLQSNPLKNLDIELSSLKFLQEIHMAFETYVDFYGKYEKYIEYVEIQTDLDKLDILIENYHPLIKELIRKKIINIKFYDRESSLLKISMKLFYFYNKNVMKKMTNIKGIIETKNFNQISEKISQIYYNSIIILISFNFEKN